MNRKMAAKQKTTAVTLAAVIAPKDGRLPMTDLEQILDWADAIETQCRYCRRELDVSHSLEEDADYMRKKATKAADQEFKDG